MHKLTTRILSLFMVFTMMLSLSPPVIAQDGADQAQQTETETAGTQLSEEGSGQPDAGTPPAENIPAEGTPVSPAPEQQPNGEEAAALPAVSDTSEEAGTLPRLTALYEGHRIHYIDSPKHPLPAEAGLFMAEIPEAEIPLYLRRAAQALGLESCGMYLYFIAAPVAENVSTSELLQFSGDENDPDDRMTVEITLFDDYELASRLQELRNAHIDDLQVILLGARWEDDVIVPHSYDEETGVIRFPVSTIDKFILIVPDWDTAVYPETEETSTDSEKAAEEEQDIGTQDTPAPEEDEGTEIAPAEQAAEEVSQDKQEEQGTETGSELPGEDGKTSEKENADEDLQDKDSGTDEAQTDEPKTDEPQGDEPKTDESQADEHKSDESQTEELKTDEHQIDELKTDESQNNEPKTEESQTDGPAAISEGTVTAEGSDYSVSLTYTTDANIPEGSVFELSEVSEGGILYDNLTNSVANTLNTNSDEIVSVTFVDVDVKKDGDSVSIDAPVNVSIDVADAPDSDTVTQVVALGEQNEVLDAQDANAASFSTVTDSLSSTYAIVKITKQATLKTSDDQTWQITVTYDRNDPGIPADAELTVTELLKGTPEYEEYVAASAAATGADPNTLSFAKAFDICLIDPATGAECQPAGEVAVSIQLLEEKVEASDKIEVVHFGAEEAPKQIDCAANSEDNAIEFATPGFSVFVVMKVVKEQILTASDGNSYKITVTYDRESGIPEDARLVVSEIREGDEAYAAYVAQSAEKLGTDPDKVNFARAFDISLKNPETGEEYQPDKSVKVSVTLLDETVSQDSRIDVVHFPGEADGETEIMETNINGEAVEFSTDGFSVYVIIDHEGGEVKEPRVEFHYIASDFELEENGKYKASPFLFVNKKGEVQVSQILKNGEALEMIANPRNIAAYYDKTSDVAIDSAKTYYTYDQDADEYIEVSEPDVSKIDTYYEKLTAETFFYGWYVVEMDSDTTQWVSSKPDEPWTGKITYSWTEDMKVEDETPASIIGNDGNQDGKLIAGETVTWTIGTASDTAILDETGTAHVYLAPAFEDFNFANYHMGNKEADDGLKNNLLTRRLVVFGTGSSAAVHIGDIKCPSPDPEHQIFAGWETVIISFNEETQKSEYITEHFYQTVDAAGNEIKKTVNMDGTEAASAGEGFYVIIEKNDSAVQTLDLYPVFAEARWLHYDIGDSGNDALYVASEYRLTNDNKMGTFFDSLHTSVRSGYSFDGWYVNGAMADSEIKNLSGNYDLKATVKIEGVDTEVTTHYNQAIRLTDADGNFVADVKGKVFYRPANTPADTETEKYSYIECAATLPEGATKLFEITEITGEGELWGLYTYKALDALKVSAKWDKIAQTPIRVVIWKQKVTDDKDTDKTPVDLLNWLKEDSSRKASEYPNTIKEYDYEIFYTKADASTSAVPDLTSFSGSFVDKDGNTHNVTNLNLKALTTNTPVYLTDFTGFHYSCDDAFLVGAPSPDGTSVYNVYYDRSIHTLSFGVGYIQDSAGIFGLYNNTIYLRLYMAGSSAYYFTYNGGWSTYLYEGKVFKRTGNYGNYTYTETSDYGSGSLYGLVNESYVSLSRYNYNGTKYSPNIVYYMTDLYGKNIGSNFSKPPFSTNYKGYSWKDVNPFHYSYILSSVDKIPEVDVVFVGEDSGTQKTVYYYVEMLPGDTSENTRMHNGVRYKYYKEISHNYRYITYDEEYHPLEGFERDRYSLAVPAFASKYSTSNDTWYASNSGYNYCSDTQAPIGSNNVGEYNKNYLYYSRISSEFTFNVNYPVGTTISFSHGKSENRTEIVPYEMSLAAYGSSVTGDITNWYYGVAVNGKSTADHKLIAPDHYIFGGWYEDASCTVEFNFNSTMPAANKMIYAKWTPEKFRVQINPNGAEIDHIDHTGGSYNKYGLSPFVREATDERSVDSGYDKNRATYFNNTYGETIGEYAVSRKYVPIGDSAAEIYKEQGGRLYYYVNFQYQNSDGPGLPSDLRNALYIDVTDNDSELIALYDFWKAYVNKRYDEDPDSYIGMTAQTMGYDAWRRNYVEKKENSDEPQLFRRCNSKETWKFLGWYKDGESMPYDFSAPVEEPIALTAKWRLDGGYKIQYIPEYRLSQDEIVNGQMVDWVDPVFSNSKAESVLSYTDGAKTTVYKQPTNLTLNGTPLEEGDNSLIFRGWRLVSVTSKEVNGSTVNTYTPLEPGVFYDPGDDFFIDVQYADTENIIHMQAVYEKTGDSYRRPEIANLTLDANTGYLVDADGQELKDNTNPDWVGVGTVLMDSGREQIIFGDIQSNIALRLYQYASDLSVDSAGNALDPEGTNYFKHENGYLMLGFDDEMNEVDYVASYPADSVIAVQRTDSDTIYAVWEPMVYITFVNDTPIHTDTAEFDGGDVTFNITSDKSEVLQVITIKNGLYTRTPLSGLSEITVSPNEQVTLVFPKGDEETIKINGVNMLGIGKKLLWNTSINGIDTASYAENETVKYSHNGCDHVLAHGEANNTKPFEFNEKLLTDPNGLVVTFTAKEVAYVLLCEDNFPDGGTQEYDYSAEYVDTEDTTVALPNPSTRFGYEFRGWAYVQNAETANIPAEPENSRIISDLKAFFLAPENEKYISHSDNTTTVIRRLYAVWDVNTETSHVHVYKSVPKPGNQQTEFTFTIDITATFQKGNKTETKNQSRTFTLANDEYADIHSEKNVNGGYIKSTITVYDAKRNVKETKELKAQSTYNQPSSIPKESIKVTENAVLHYDTSVRILGYSTGHPIQSQANSVSWDSAETGGTVVFTNTRETRDITVKKVLDSNETTGVFQFSASYTDGTAGAYDELTVDLNDFTLNKDGTKILKIPAGAALTVTEYGTNLVDYIVTASHTVSGTALETLSVMETDITENNVTTYFRSVSLNNVTVDDTITFTNTLIRYPVKFIKTDESGTVNSDGSNAVEAYFDLDAESHGLFKELYSNQSNKGVFYPNPAAGINEPLYAGHVYTLTETWVDPAYTKLVDPVTIIVSGKEGEEFKFRDKNGNVMPDITAEYNVDDELWEIRVKNRKCKKITVQKELYDSSVDQREFTFSGGYTLDGLFYGLDRRVYNEKKPYTFTLKPTSSEVAEKSLDIPVGATSFYVFEDTSLPLEESSSELVAEFYETTVTYTGQDAANLNETTRTGQDGSGNEILSPTCKIMAVRYDGTVTFTNSHGTGSRRVILRKVQKDTYEPLERTFVIHSGRPDGNTVTTFTSGGNGAFFVGELNYGTYYLNETDNGKWFFLIVDEAGVFDSMTKPYDSTAAVQAAAAEKIKEINGQT